MMQAQVEIPVAPILAVQILAQILVLQTQVLVYLMEQKVILVQPQALALVKILALA